MTLPRISVVLALIVLMSAACPTPVSAERWDYLFEDLAWPSSDEGEAGESSLSIGGFSDAGRDWGISNSGFWSYLFEDIAWPEGFLIGSPSTQFPVTI
ncbi:MAG: hypothetical protein ABIG34_02170 [Candidatus Peregrinibacteria bacterium]